MLDKTDDACPLSSCLEIISVEVVVIAHTLTDITADEKNFADVIVLPGQRHFVKGLKFVFGEINLDCFVAVFNLLLDDERGGTLDVVAAVDESGVDKSIEIG